MPSHAEFLWDFVFQSFVGSLVLAFNVFGKGEIDVNWEDVDLLCVAGVLEINNTTEFIVLTHKLTPFIVAGFLLFAFVAGLGLTVAQLDDGAELVCHFGIILLLR